MTELYRKRGIEDIDKAVNDAIKKSGFPELMMEVLNFILLSLPFFALIIPASEVLLRLSFSDNSVLVIGYLAIVIAGFSLYKVNEQFLEKKNRYKRLIREFDAMFKNDVWKRRRYGTLVFLTDLFLISITVIIIYCGNVIRHS